MRDKKTPQVKRIIIDVRSPRDRQKPVIKKRRSAGFFSRNGFLPKPAPVKRSRLGFKILGRVISFSVSALMVVVASYSIYIWSYSDEALKSAHLIYDNFKSVIADIAKLKTDSAHNSLDQINGELNGLQSRAAPLSIAPYLKNIPGALLDVKGISDKLASINAGIDYLQKNGFDAAFNGGGDKLLSTLKKMDADLTDLQTTAGSLNSHASPFYGLLGQNPDYLKMTTQLIGYREALESFIKLMEQVPNTHLLVLFQNPSEIRPSGGFTGSYADLVLGGGEVKEINVNDIYYPEHFLKEHIVPPMQLQGITLHWGPQDANWFFDFPTSARKAMELTGKSSVYAEKSIKFDGAVSINIRLVEDLLKLVGPIDVPSYGYTLDANNFMRVVQKEVEEGRDKIPGQNPKRILNVITPILMSRLKDLDSSQKSQLIDIFKNRFGNKDIQFYFNDKKLEGLMTEWGGAGEVYRLPANFTGDYLAVVNANVAGGKTDAVISQKIDLNSIIQDDGTISDILTVERIHNGANEKEARYRAKNQNFVKIFTPPSVKLIDLKGNTEKVVKPVLDYKNLDYETDHDLLSVESTKKIIDTLSAATYAEAGKNVFATWFSIGKGEDKKLSVVYESTHEMVIASGAKYEFIFDKQSGVESDFRYMVKAPSGFVWRESNDPTFSYETHNLPARIKIELTLDKAESIQ